MNSNDLRKFAHDIRGPVHSARLNLEAARLLAARAGGKEAERLTKHLQIIHAELERLDDVVAAFSKKLGS